MQVMASARLGNIELRSRLSCQYQGKLYRYSENESIQSVPYICVIINCQDPSCHYCLPLMFLIRWPPPANSRGSTVRYPRSLSDRSRRGGGLCSSITSTISSSLSAGDLVLVLVSSTTIVSLLLALRGGLLTSRISLLVTLALLGLRESRRTISSLSTISPPPARLKHV